MGQARLMLLVTDLQLGGTPTVVRDLAVRLHQAGVEVEVACLASWGPVADQIQAAGVKVTALNANGARDLAVLGRLVRLVKERQVTTLFTMLIHANIAGAYAKLRVPGLRVVQSIQTTQPRPRWHWWAQGVVHHAAECLIVSSPSVAAALRQRSGVPERKLQVVSNAIDVSQFADVHQPLMAPERVTVGFIGRLDPVKRIGDLIEAAGLLGERYHVHIFGAGEERSRLERRIGELKLEDRVLLRGPVKGPREALEQMNVLVLPSEAEGFGLVLIEAMAAGVAVVGTDVPGIRDVVRHEQTGLLVPVRSPGSLAAAVRRLAEDGDLRERLTRQGRAEVVERFAWAPVLARYRQLLGV